MRSLDWRLITLQSIFVFLLQLSFVMTKHFGNYDDHRDEPPVFLPRATNVSAHKGDTAILTCGIKNLGTKTVIWRRASDPNPLTIGQQPYVGEGRFSAEMDEEKNEWRLLIKNVVASDAGVYECQISSRQKLIHHILLRVNGTPLTARPERVNYDSFKQEVSSPAVVTNTKSPAISVTGTMFVEKGDLIHLVCNATGVKEPPENLDWFKDGIKLSPDGIRQILIDKFYVRTTRTLVSKLEIRHSQMADAGTYVCRSSNLAITSMKVHVLNAGSINVRRDKAGEGNSHKELQQNEDEARYTDTQKERNCCHMKSSHPLLICLTLLLLFCQIKQSVSLLRR